MLFVGAAGHGDESLILDQLIQCGALPGDSAAPPAWDPVAPAIYVLHSARAGWAGGHIWPGLHLVIAADGRCDADILAGPAAEQIGSLWERRLVPFEVNLRTGRRAPRRAASRAGRP